MIAVEFLIDHHVFTITCVSGLTVLLFTKLREIGTEQTDFFWNDSTEVLDNNSEQEFKRCFVENSLYDLYF